MRGMHSSRPLLVVLVVLAASALSLAACGSGNEQESAAAPADSTTAPAPGAGFPRTVTRAMGTTEIPAEPLRVVVLDTGVLDSVVTLGITPVGAVTTDVDEGFLSYLRSDAAIAAKVGTIGEPNLEAIAAQRPDLILSNKVRHEDLYDELSQIAPTVFAERVGVVWKDNLRLAATALGREKEAEAAIAAYEADAEGLGRSLPDRSITLSPLRFVEGTIRVYSKESFIGTLLTDIGIAPPALPPGEFPAFAEISQEQLASADADVVVYASFGAPADSGEAAVLAGPLWASLGAVKAGRAFAVDGDIFYSGIGLRAATLMLEDLREMLA